MPKSFGRLPRPSILILDPDDRFADDLGSNWSSVRRIKSLSEIHQVEWDLVVSSVGVPPTADERLFFVAIGGTNCGVPELTHSHAMPLRLYRVLETRARHFDIPYGVPPEIAALVERDLVPLLNSREANRFLTLGWDTARSGAQQLMTELARGIFVQASSGEPFAMSFPRPGRRAVCWALPDGADPQSWTDLAITHFRQLDPVRFPAVIGEWRERPRWQMPSERTAAARLKELIAEKHRVEMELSERIEEAARTVREAREHVDASSRRLLTDQGEPLVEEVAEALGSFGADVQRMDELWPHGDRREDLRVRLGDGEWEAIVEVRGYKGGAKLADLLRLQRFAQRYERDVGREPSASWLIVNSQYSEDPDERHLPLLEHPEELAVFAEQYHGVVIDTRDLFQLVRDIDSDEISRENARKILRSATDRLQCPRPG